MDGSIMRSRGPLRAVAISPGILGITALVQTAIFVATGSVALLADLVHNFGDAATAVPVAIAFLLRSFRAEKIAGFFVVGAIFVSACSALYATIQRFIDLQELSHLGALAAAGVSSASSGTSSPPRCARLHRLQVARVRRARPDFVRSTAPSDRRARHPWSVS